MQLTLAAHPASGGMRPLSAVPRDSVRPQSGRQRSIRCVQAVRSGLRTPSAALRAEPKPETLKPKP